MCLNTHSHVKNLDIKETVKELIGLRKSVVRHTKKSFLEPKWLR
jgi:hypothetical protein